RHLAETRHMPVIFITARGEATDRIVGLEIGADDYVVKPFDPRELVARIRSVLRRAGRGPAEPDDGQSPAIAYDFEGWQLDPLKRRLIDPQGVVV
ncbi:response regulator, partial [Klebsiella pneumoniae]|uniref:response regulator n=1 Tax=Klebsiella pneumoniae TaxID=573 RepID=UPI0038537ED4